MPIRNTTRRAPRAVRGAFTLLEVLVVVAIIVMLAGVGGYYLLQRYEEAKLSRAKMDAQGLSQQAETYKLNNGQYPASIDALAAPQPNGGTPLVQPDALNDPWGKRYIIDPNGGHHQGLMADVYTTGPQGQVIGNWK
jgi:general secretion pathway protein G